MKKLTKIVLLVVVLVMSLVLATACETLENHQHKPASEWLFDGTSHYHACTFEGCTEKLDVTACAGGTATCTQKATCATCGNQYGQLAEHVFDQEVATADYIKTQANHTDKAVYYKSCVCGEKSTTDTFVYGEVVAHEYTSVVTAPTCTTAGYTTYTCECGHTYTDNEVDALGHNEVTDEAKAPTCTETGLTEGKHCDVCGEVLVAQETVPATGHTFIDSKCACGAEYEVNAEWVLTTTLKNGDQVLIGAPHYGKLLSAEKVSAGSYYNKGVDYSETNFANVTDAEIFVVTANEDGTYTFTSLTGKVIALASSYSSLNETGEHKSWALTDREDGTFLVKNTGRNTYLEWYSSKNNWSTYTAGNTKEYYLSFYAKNADYSDAHVHNHISAVTEPTCTEAGYTTYTCSCGDTYTVEGAPATGHTETTDEAKAPTCTEAGLTEGKHCSVCGEILVAQQEAGEALGHDYKDGTCSVCGEADPDYVAPTPVSGGSADFDTITTSNTSGGDSGYKNTYTTTNGWTTVACAIQTGGTAVANPAFPVVGADKTSKAVCLTGSTTLPGKVTSPTLTGGISTLTIKYTKMFTDLKLSVTVTVTDLATGTKYTHVIARDVEKDTDKYVVWEDVWTLETPVTGDFTIEVVNNSPSANTGNKDRFTILDLVWEGAKEEHVHEYTSTTTATCTTAGTTTYTCACGDTYSEDVAKLGHIDENLDLKCDRTGCTASVAPKADTTLSLTTANLLGSKLSTSNKYYVEGKIVRYYTEGDVKNGIFWIADENGVEFLIRMPKNEAGSVHSSWDFRLVIGDTIKVYGTINKFTSSSTSIPSMQSGLFVEYISKHTCDFTTTPATCFEPAYCDCLASHGTPNAHVDADTDNLCDNCGLNANTTLSKISTRFKDIKETEAYDATAGTATFVGADFTAVFAKGTATLNTNGTDHMRLQKGNTLTISANNGKKISAITFTAVGASYVDEMEAILTAAGITFVTDGLNTTITVDNLDTFTLNNTTKIARIAAIYVSYIDAPAA